MNASPDVVIIGGGIVGLCTALAAADRGLEVRVFDADLPGAASRASAGMLGPSLPGLPSTVQDVARAARDLYPQTIARLTSGSDIEIALDRSGIIEIAVTEGELDVVHARACASARLDRRALAELEPALRVHPGGVLHALDGWVDNVAMMEALSVCAGRHPRVQVVAAAVTEVDVAHPSSAAVVVDGARIACSRIVIAAGAWVHRLAGLPRRIPVLPVKGELLTLNRVDVRHVVYGAAGYVVPRGHTLLVGATSDAGLDDATPTETGRQALSRAASALIPGLSRSDCVTHWAGVRPVSPDGMPILGEEERAPALVYGCGFSRNGILLAPWAAGVLASLLAEDGANEVPVEFHPGRFGN